ncbi:MAG: DUF294 nucleotidyltransferase-like domain-containing protein [Bacteroidota bacterium]
MPENNLNRFFLFIVFPSILAIGFFILLIFTIVLPSFEKNIMEGKKETIFELTNTAWSLLEEYHHEVLQFDLPEDSARILAAERIKQIRYGDEYKDYFWIIDKQPVMIMHPYRPELANTDLSDYQDPDGKLLFVEATRIVAENGEGFINYMWQWKDDSTRIVPKLSYVKEFAPWGWIVGTGIYLEDVHREIKALKSRLLQIVLLFALLIGTILAFIVKQSFGIENRRKNAERKLRLSRQKYKSLVEASTEGTLMILMEEIIFSNVKFSNLSEYDPFEVRKLRFGDLFSLEWKKLVGLFDDPKKSVSLEATLNCKDGGKKEVVLSASMISYGDEKGYIIIVKEISLQRQLAKETKLLKQELQSSLLLMNQPIKPLINDLKKCEVGTSIREAALLMTRKKRDVLFISQGNEIIGVINNNDLKKRVLAAGIDPGTSVIEIMTSPVETISENALLYEALLILKNRNVSHLATVDARSIINGVIGYKDIIDIKQNTISFLIKEIETAEDVNQLVAIYKRVPVLVKALLDSGDKTGNINRIITSVSDAIYKRVIHSAIEDLGQPPSKFAFIVMGSEGRGEQTLATDQDNAIIFEDVEEKRLGYTHKYFLELGARLNRDLNRVGYNYCKGEIMARNPKWTQPLGSWKKYFSQWINTCNPQDILDVAIFFDFRCVYGDRSMAEALRNHIISISDNKPVFYYHMAQAVQKFKPPLNIFGHIVGKKSQADELILDMKEVMFPIITFIQLYSIRDKLTQTNSLERLSELFSGNSIDKTSHEDLCLAYNFMMHLRLTFQVESITQNEIPNNIVNINKLTSIEVATLKKLFSEMGNIQAKVSHDFKGGD